MKCQAPPNLQYIYLSTSYYKPKGVQSKSRVQGKIRYLAENSMCNKIGWLSFLMHVRFCITYYTTVG